MRPSGTLPCAVCLGRPVCGLRGPLCGRPNRLRQQQSACPQGSGSNPVGSSFPVLVLSALQGYGQAERRVSVGPSLSVHPGRYPQPGASADRCSRPTRMRNPRAEHHTDPVTATSTPRARKQAFPGAVAWDGLFLNVKSICLHVESGCWVRRGGATVVGAQTTTQQSRCGRTRWLAGGAGFVNDAGGRVRLGPAWTSFCPVAIKTSQRWCNQELGVGRVARPACTANAWLGVPTSHDHPSVWPFDGPTPPRVLLANRCKSPPPPSALLVPRTG